MIWTKKDYEKLLKLWHDIEKEATKDELLKKDEKDRLRKNSNHTELQEEELDCKL